MDKEKTAIVKEKITMLKETNVMEEKFAMVKETSAMEKLKIAM